ncbi:MAG TPA: universal stress protein [Isosphaeraceae bacterium]|jgi:nucleotide-binding universal stress UspA family protein|nr:universal stress protein [Isosphaeraceae bacterium]
MLPIKTILVPTDFSESSEHALRMACALARDYEARLVLLHVAPPPIVGGTLAVPVDPRYYREALDEALAKVEPAELRGRVERHLREGDAAAEVLRMAEEKECDLIVMGSHGRRMLGRLLLGSVAEMVMRGSPCPVLVVRAPIRSATPAPAQGEGEARPEPVATAAT